jgi:hypothetical protein
VPNDSLNKLSVDELKDLFSAESQLLKALPKMVQSIGHIFVTRVAGNVASSEIIASLEMQSRSLGSKPFSSWAIAAAALLRRR